MDQRQNKINSKCMKLGKNNGNIVLKIKNRKFVFQDKYQFA